MSKKLVDVMDDRPMKYPSIQERPNECDELDTEEESHVKC